MYVNVCVSVETDSYISDQYPHKLNASHNASQKFSETFTF